MLRDTFYKEKYFVDSLNLDDVPGGEVHQAEAEAGDEADADVEDEDGGREAEVDVDRGPQQPGRREHGPEDGDWSVAPPGVAEVNMGKWAIMSILPIVPFICSVSHLMISAATAGPDAKVRKMKMELAREASARPTPNLSLMRGTKMPKE